MIKKLILLVIIFGILFTLGAGCVDSKKDPSDYNNINYRSVNIVKDICYPIDYDNGVYYFPCNKADFGNSLSSWKAVHKNEIVTSIATNDADGYETTIGYFVNTELYNIKKEDLVNTENYTNLRLVMLRPYYD
jgi:hypothetical protein